MKLWWDLETYSETPITDGAHRYAEKAEVLLFAWAVDDGPVQCWEVQRVPCPEELGAALLAADEYWGHNSGGFDRVIIKHAIPEFHYIMDEWKHRDTMAQALCHGLPGKLDTLCEIFNLGADVSKHKRGKQLIRMFCMPQPANQKLRRKTRETHPAEWREFIEYAKSDISSMRVLHQKMPKWNYPNNASELALWQLDQRINQAGIYVDLELAEKAIEAVDVAQTGLAQRTHEATGGEVASATQRDALLAHILASYGVSLPDMRADTLERRLDDTNLPDGVRDLIGIRLMASKSSVSKYKRLMRCASSDGYLRGIIQFCGAGRTGRDAGRLFQPQNIMRPTLPSDEIDFGIEAIKAGCADLINDNVMELAANAMRGVIVANRSRGQKIVVADLSNIEGRVLAWLAGEEWKLQAFRDFDDGVGDDLYKITYGRTFRIAVSEVTKAMRQIGKVMELGLGFGGGVGAFLTFAATYGLDLDDMTRSGRSAIPADVWAEADNFWEWSKETKRSTYGLSHDVFCMCDSLKRLWRRAHPKTVTYWTVSEEAFRNALHNDGVVHGHCRTFKQGPWMRVELPSGRSLSYPAPRDDNGLSYMGMNQYSRKWQRLKTYGGKLVENQTQAVARDVFKSNAHRIVDAGYDIRLPIHDEYITYANDNEQYSARGLADLMCVVPSWAEGLPLAAAGFEAYRYRKD